MKAEALDLSDVLRTQIHTKKSLLQTQILWISWLQASWVCGPEQDRKMEQKSIFASHKGRQISQLCTWQLPMTNLCPMLSQAQCMMLLLHTHSQIAVQMDLQQFILQTFYWNPDNIRHTGPLCHCWPPPQSQPLETLDGVSDGAGLWQKDFLITVTLWQIPKHALVPQFPVRASDRTLWNYVTGLGVLIPARVSTKMWGMLILSVSQIKMVWNFMNCQECKYLFIASFHD